MQQLRASHGMNLRDALRIAEQLGIKYTKYSRCSEIKFHLPGRLMTIDGLRKDAPRCLTVILKRAIDTP